MANVGRVVSKILGWALVTIVALYLVINGGLWFMAKRAQSNAADELTARLASSVPVAQRANAQAAVGLPGLSKPYAQWVSQDCGLSTKDAGWMVSSYVQECELRSVVAYQAPSLDVARKAVASLPADVAGEKETSSESDCPVLSAYAPQSDSRAVGYSSVQTQFLHPKKPGSDYWCGNSTDLLGSKTAQVISGKPVALDPSTSWLVITRVEVLDNRDIGCSHWSILFCGSPWSGPVYGTPPG